MDGIESKVIGSTILNHGVSWLPIFKKKLGDSIHVGESTLTPSFCIWRNAYLFQKYSHLFYFTNNTFNVINI